MADTTNYGWTKPTVAGDTGAWGTILNTALDDIDTDLKAVSDVASAALPKAGGTMTGGITYATGALPITGSVIVSGSVTVGTGFACNGKTAQGPYTLSGEINTVYVSGAGYDRPQVLLDFVKAIAAALVADGIAQGA